MQTLNKIISIIDFLKEEDMRLQELSEALNMNISTLYRFLSELQKYNLVRKNTETQKYKLGLEFLNISSHIIDKIDIRKNAEKSLDKVSEITGETIHLGMISGNEIIYIDKRESTGPIRMYSKIGKRAPIYCTSLGKVIISFQSSKKINEYLDGIIFEKRTGNTILNKDQFLKEIKKTKKLGFATDIEEHEKGFACVAAPIKDYSKKVMASVSITIFLNNKGTEEVLKYKDIIIKTANDISKEMGYVS